MKSSHDGLNATDVTGVKAELKERARAELFLHTWVN